MIVVMQERMRIRPEAGSAEAAPNPDSLGWALRLSAPLESSRSEELAELAVPVRAGGHGLGERNHTAGLVERH